MQEEARRPGRPPNRPPVALESENALSTAAGEEAPRERRKVRNPFGSQKLKMAWPPRTGYFRHWFNDEPGRVIEAQAGGYTFVQDHSGKNVEIVVDKTTGKKAFLMEIPQEWYDEDMAEQQAKIEEMKSSISRGDIKQKSAQDGDERFYASAQGRKISVQSR